jgi:site-specific recombinase XerD
MRKRPLPSPESVPAVSSISPVQTVQSVSIPTDDLGQWIEHWFADSQIRQHSPRTIETRRILLQRLLDFLHEQNYSNCGLAKLRRFFATLNNKLTGESLRPVTIETFHRVYCAFFNWLVEEEMIPV